MTDRQRLVLLAEDAAAFAEIGALSVTDAGVQPRPVFRRGYDRARARTLTGSEERMSRYLDVITDAAPELQREVERRGLCELAQVVGAARPALARDHAPRFTVANFNALLASTGTPDLSGYQGYLDSAPNGLGIRDLWARTSARGEGVRVVDVEWGWNLRHEDLRRRMVGVIHGHAGLDDHGTAVLGILGADHNGIGIRGICPHSPLDAASGDDDDDGVWNPETAIEAALDTLEAGDVLVLEMHTAGPLHPGGDEDYGLVPVEYVYSTYEAIQTAVAAGIVVVEAAGNGAISLDDWSLDDLFDRYVRDSGAILVGAGTSSQADIPRSRLHFSNWGSRVDVQAWGERVATTGGTGEARYHDLHPPPGVAPHPNRCYTASFSGTSSATPLVAGVVALVNSACRRAGLGVPEPERLRALLIETATPAADPNDEIGPLPNALALASRLGAI